MCLFGCLPSIGRIFRKKNYERHEADGEEDDVKPSRQKDDVTMNEKVQETRDDTGAVASNEAVAENQDAVPGNAQESEEEITAPQVPVTGTLVDVNGVDTSNVITTEAQVNQAEEKTDEKPAEAAPVEEDVNFDDIAKRHSPEDDTKEAEEKADEPVAKLPEETTDTTAETANGDAAEDEFDELAGRNVSTPTPDDVIENDVTINGNDVTPVKGEDTPNKTNESEKFDDTNHTNDTFESYDTETEDSHLNKTGDDVIGNDSDVTDSKLNKTDSSHYESVDGDPSLIDAKLNGHNDTLDSSTDALVS